MSLKRPRKVRVLLRSAVAIIAVALLATAAVAATSSHDAGYRTAIASRATVEAQLHLTGTIEPVAQATVAFPVAGTVATVAVKAGTKVSTGQTLANLETSSLAADLTAKNANLAAAELTLEKAENGESTGGAGGSATGNTSRESTTPTTAAAATSASESESAPTKPTSGATGSNAALTSARAAVTRAEHQVQAALTAASAAMDAAATACATPPAPESTTTTSAAETIEPTCATAQAAAMRALQRVSSQQRGLAAAQANLEKILASSSASTPTTAAPAQSAAPTSTTVTYTAKQLASFAAAVLAASAEVATAQQALAQATIVSPITGVVAVANLTTGATVSAASTTANIVVVGNGGYEVTTTMSVADRAKVKVGDAATVVADGTSTELAAQVVAIGAASTSDGTTTYPVVVGFTKPTAAADGLRNGASASVTITVARAANALSVPTSAVQTVGSVHTVTVITNDKPKIVRVQLGTIGAERTVITSGIKAGQVVALADLDLAIPSAGTNTRFGGNGTFGRGLGGNGTLRFGGPGR